MTEIDALNARLSDAADHLDHLGDADAKRLVSEIVALVSDLHGVAVTRMLEIIEEAAPTEGGTVLTRLLDDEFVSSLFDLHELRPPEPVPVEIRRSR